MSEVIFDLDAYFKRIDYSGPVEPTVEVLNEVHRAQLFHIPFENLDIMLGRGISLEPADLFEKMVHRRRGGYCFELNGLLLLALQAMGFNVRPLLGRVHVTGTATGRGHQLNLVIIDGQPWLADVGFGSSGFRSPMALELNRPNRQDGYTYRLVASFKLGMMLQIKTAEQWQDLYSFDMEEVCPADIDYANYYTSTHPEFIFTQACVAMQMTADGYRSLFNQAFKTVAQGRVEVVEIPVEQPYLDLLREQFNLALDGDGEALLAAVNRRVVMPMNRSFPSQISRFNR